MTDTMNDQQRAEFLAGLGLSPDAPALAADIAPEAPAKVKKAKADKAKKPKKGVTVTKTERVDDIAFDASLLDDYVLDRTDIKAASDLLFQAYKFPRGDERNKLLHRKITEFIDQVKRSRNPQPRDGFIKTKVKAGKDKRDLATMLDAAGIDADDLALMLQALADKRATQS